MFCIAGVDVSTSVSFVELDGDLEHLYVMAN